MGNCSYDNSLTSGDYNDKLGESKKMNNKEGELISKAALTNLQLTGGEGDYATMNRNEFRKMKLPESHAEEKKKQIEDLKEAHFKFGYEPTDYASEFAGNFQNLNPQSALPNVVDTYALQKNHYNFGRNQAPDQVYKSSYGQEIGSINQANAIVPKPFLSSAQKNRSDVLIGTKDGAKESEQKGQFNLANSSGKATKPSVNLNFAQTNIPIGGFRNNYASVYSDQFGDKNDSFNKVSLNQEAKSILRKTNFSYGMRPVKPETTHNATYQNRPGGGTQELSEQMIFDLKGKHLHYGDDKENWNTTSKSYLTWKQPEKNMYASKN